MSSALTGFSFDVHVDCIIVGFLIVNFVHIVPLIDWISDTLSQGYTDLQSLVKCLDHRDIVSDTGCSQAKVVIGCAMQ